MKRKTILLVEDEVLIAMNEARMLRSEGYRVELAANGEEAIEIIRSGRRMDLILLDVIMPVMDGGVFLQKLKQERGVSIPVVPCSVDEKSVECLTSQQQFENTLQRHWAAVAVDLHHIFTGVRMGGWHIAD